MIRHFLSVYMEILRGHGLIICFSTLKRHLKKEKRLASSIGHLHDDGQNTFRSSFHVLIWQSQWGFDNKSPNLHKKAESWRILVVVVKWRHHASGLLLWFSHDVIKIQTTWTTEWIIKLLWNLAFVTPETPDYCPAMAFERSGCRAGCKAVTNFSWSRVINTIPVAIRHFEHTVTELLISNCLDISTAPWSLLEETVMPRNLLLSEVIHLTELCTDIVTTLKPSSRKSCSWLGQAFVVISMNENKAKVNSMIGDRSISRSVW